MPYKSETDDKNGYDTLYGPDGFECTLTEPEDRTWGRDGKDVVEKLNAQHESLQKTRKTIEEVYLALLITIDGILRIRLDSTLAALRDNIAELRGQEPQAVQEEFERFAREMTRGL
jgi:hypothetical protein